MQDATMRILLTLQLARHGASPGRRNNFFRVLVQHLIKRSTEDADCWTAIYLLNFHEEKSH